jgi:hypothetical protein
MMYVVVDAVFHSQPHFLVFSYHEKAMFHHFICDAILPAIPVTQRTIFDCHDVCLFRVIIPENLECLRTGWWFKPSEKY